MKERIEGAPNLVLEVLSPTTIEKDRRRKLAVCSQFGVGEYWIVDPEAQTIEVYARERDQLRLTRTFPASQTLESPLLPGFRLPVASIF